MPTPGIYTRYSDDAQKATSIDDQVRRCRQVAGQQGLTVKAEFEFSDSAITGRESGRSKRTGYQRMLDAIEAREIDVAIADEVSRFTRHITEGGKLMDLVEKLGVRFITADGIDTTRDGWRQMWMLKLMQASMEVEATGHRTTRGMLGQLERGYQIAQASYGYRPVKKMTESGRILGTVWELNEVEASVVRMMYQLRYDGLSVASIAKRLQELKITPAGQNRVDGSTYWRPGTVHRLLRNTTYRGVFQWNGSGFTKSKARRQRKQVTPIDFERPQLRIVSDDIWYAVNSQRNQRTVSARGSGKYLFSGLVKCSDCNAFCAIGSGGLTVYCAQCQSAYRVGARDRWIGYTSGNATKYALRWVLENVFSDTVKAEFHKRLDERLKFGPREELAACQKRNTELQARIDRIKLLMLDLERDPGIFGSELNSAASELRVSEARVASLKRLANEMSQEVVDIQRNVNPMQLLDELLDGHDEVYKTRATLRRLLSKFVLISRPGRGHTVFRIAVCPGKYAAEVTETSLIYDGEFEFEVHVIISAARPCVWHVYGHRITD